MIKVTYRDRIFLDKYSCIDKPCKVILYKNWYNGNLLYGYKNSFEVVSISKEDILSIENI